MAPSGKRAHSTLADESPLATASHTKATANSRSSTNKKARAHVDPSEVTLVSTLDESMYKLPLADADVLYHPTFVDEKTANRWYNELLDIPGWYQPTLKMYGKEITQSRKIAAFATDPALVVKYSGQIVNMQYDYPPVLRQIQNELEQRLGVRFNHCMANWYEDGRVYIGNHRDNKENRVIASLSLGAPRTFIMRHDALAKTSRARATATGADSGDEPLLFKQWTLANGSLVIQQGSTQLKWKHEIPKEPKVKDGRISLTFRQLVF
ncbi:hypothetical protein ACM66B_006391 [Microbotryomycetes sp. NB124-2]